MFAYSITFTMFAYSITFTMFAYSITFTMFAYSLFGGAQNVDVSNNISNKWCQYNR